ncbi:TM2 domain-containing protein [Phenylobacterium sp. SCN 70-31]|uniref:TM2 domain-containing protein n=1 Tax=Phenylobacterium sp. SCN 70-31 TaxID=1660129 RepID=UPI0025DD9C06|nr:TM2 domain-containing protein [Phenylobacterium sp. SCN 70-31]
MSTTINAGLSADAQALMAFQTGKKSAGAAYLLWFFLGGVGAHRFYMGLTGSAIGQLVLSVLGWATIWFGIGFLFLAALGIWLLIDLFTLAGKVKTHNMMLMAKLSGGSSALGVMAAN